MFGSLFNEVKGLSVVVVRDIPSTFMYSEYWRLACKGDH